MEETVIGTMILIVELFIVYVAVSLSSIKGGLLTLIEKLEESNKIQKELHESLKKDTLDYAIDELSQIRRAT